MPRVKRIWDFFRNSCIEAHVDIENKGQGQDVYFALMVLVYLNQISAQEVGIDHKTLISIELGAAKFTKDYMENKKDSTQRFFN